MFLYYEGTSIPWFWTVPRRQTQHKLHYILSKGLYNLSTFPAHSWLTSTQRQCHMAINRLSQPSIWQTRAKLLYNHTVYITWFWAPFILLFLDFALWDTISVNCYNWCPRALECTTLYLRKQLGWLTSSQGCYVPVSPVPREHQPNPIPLTAGMPIQLCSKSCAIWS